MCVFIFCFVLKKGKKLKANTDPLSIKSDIEGFYFRNEHYVRGTFKVPRTFSRFSPFLDKKHTRCD